jgi:hypothetical protein
VEIEHRIPADRGERLEDREWEATLPLEQGPQEPPRGGGGGTEDSPEEHDDQHGCTDFALAGHDEGHERHVSEPYRGHYRFRRQF